MTEDAVNELALIEFWTGYLSEQSSRGKHGYWKGWGRRRRPIVDVADQLRIISQCLGRHVERSTDSRKQHSGSDMKTVCTQDMQK
jgi:hypothetical protein